jgi:hypothetical protein
VTINHHITDKLESALSIDVDGEAYVEATAPHPVFLTRDLNAYKRYYNRSQEQTDAGLSFALLTHLAIAGTLSLKQRTVLLKYFEDRQTDLDAGCVLFRKGAYGESPPGETTMRMTGAVKEWDWRKLVGGEWPNDATKPNA